jgi:hypothetical protein
MSKNVEAPTCTYCGSPMKKWHTPQVPFGGSTTWTSEFLYICFNDECPYFVNGWDWMWNNYHRSVSYRHMFDPGTGKTSPIPVKSYDSLKEGIIEE